MFSFWSPCRQPIGSCGRQAPSGPGPHCRSWHTILLLSQNGLRLQSQECRLKRETLYSTPLYVYCTEITGYIYSTTVWVSCKDYFFALSIHGFITLGHFFLSNCQGLSLCRYRRHSTFIRSFPADVCLRIIPLASPGLFSPPPFPLIN